MLKNKYKRWLNLELFKAEGGPSKFEKIKEVVEILHSIRPEVGRFCWDDTIFRGRNNEPEVPEEILSSHVEVQEEMMQKVTIANGPLGSTKCLLKMMLKVTKM